MNLQHDDHDDTGFVIVWVALMIGVLLGVGALVIDAGALYVERRQLQNGADAAALAVAADCVEGDCSNETGTADTYADSNANDGAANVDEVCGSGPGLAACTTSPTGTEGSLGWVQVSTSTHNPSNGDDTQVKFVLAPVLDAANVGRTVRASAIAAWGSVGWATTFPIIFSLCEFEALGGSLDGLDFPDTPGYIYLHGQGPDHSCAGNPSGQNLPGGFSWLTSTDCQASVAVDGWAGSDPGNKAPCDPTPWRNADVLIPLFDDVRDSGTNAEYHVVGFTGFRVLGYKLGDEHTWNVDKCPGTTGSSGRCVYGEFSHVTTTGDGFGGGPDFGARAVSMIG